MRKPCPELDAARASGEKWYFTGRVCVHGHLSEKDTRTRTCRECSRISRIKKSQENKIKCRKWYLENLEKHRVYTRAWREKNKERKNASERNRRSRNQEHCAALSRASQRRNYEKRKTSRRKWIKENSDKVCAMANRRHAQKKMALPRWQNPDELVGFYTIAARLSKCIGIPHQVDHYIPLQGVNVKGLHVPWNLRVIPRSINVRKGNRLDA